MMKARDKKSVIKPRIIRYGSPGIARAQTLDVQRKQIGKILKSNTFQRESTISPPNNKYEQEANRFADKVMSKPDPKLQRQEIAEKEVLQHQAGEKENLHRLTSSSNANDLRIQTKGEGDKQPAVAPGLDTKLQNLRGTGQPFPVSERKFFEPRIGYDLGSVRVHDDNNAKQVAQSVQARAFTLGRDVVFGAGEYTPRSTESRRLLAHELTHVLQQTRQVRTKSRFLRDT